MLVVAATVDVGLRRMDFFYRKWPLRDSEWRGGWTEEARSRSREKKGASTQRTKA